MFSKKKPILNVINLKKYYKSKSGTVKAVDDVSFKLHPGEIIGLIGESGSGKTTIANLLLRLLPDYSGIVTFDNKIISGKSISRARKKMLHKNIQMTFHKASRFLQLHDPRGLPVLFSRFLRDAIRQEMP